MLKNYIKIAFRNLAKDKGYTAINITSLAIGVGIFIFMLLLYQYAVTYDSFYPNGDRIYRVVDRIQTSDGSEVHTARTPWKWAPAMESDFPEIESSVRFLIRGKSVTRGNDAFNIGISYVDSSFFDVFNLPLESGDPKTALQGPNKAVIDQYIVDMMFGDEDPMGKVLLIEGKSYEISGVLKEMPANTSIYYEMLVSAENLSQNDLESVDDWKSHEAYTYLLLNEGVNPESVENQFSSFLDRYIGEVGHEEYSPELQALTEMYLTSGLQAEHGLTLNPSYLYIFLAIGLLVLVISCINFINITTARAAKRNTEVGIRKVIGASREQLIFQYLLEVAILTVFSMIIAIVLVEWALPFFNALTGEWQVKIDYAENSFFWGSVASIIVFVTLVAGAYPAFYLSGFQPSRVFKKSSKGSSGSWLRNTLVVSQFSLAVFLLFSSLVVNDQIKYLQEKDLGFNQENLMRMFMAEDVDYDDALRYRDELLRNPQITEVSLSSDSPISDGAMVKYQVPESEVGFSERIINTLYTDHHFIPLMDLKIVAGRNFNAEMASDSLSTVIINQTAVKQFGWEGQDAIGQILRVQTNDESYREAMVIGVMSDYNFQSLQQQIKPLAIQYQPSKLSNLLIRVSAPDSEQINNYIETSWKEFFPGQFFFFYYISDLIFETYSVEHVISQLLTMMTWLTIFIASLGLLGLASYTFMQKTKEIGIRKIMGATTREIVAMFSRDFLRYVIIGILIGLPVAWFLVSQWLRNFAYHTDIDFWTILVVIASILTIGWVTIAWQSIKAAMANPVDSLRSE